MHKDILKVLKAIRGSFHDAAIVYTFGGCYGLFQVMKSIYPKAIAYKEVKNSHAVIRIGNKYYDIYGEYVDVDGKQSGKLVRINLKDVPAWESIAAGQRLEYIVAKYNRFNKHKNK